eukprot:3279758-Amphidinium_carterae.2
MNHMLTTATVLCLISQMLHVWHQSRERRTSFSAQKAALVPRTSIYSIRSALARMAHIACPAENTTMSAQPSFQLQDLFKREREGSGSRSSGPNLTNLNLAYYATLGLSFLNLHQTTTGVSSRAS